MTIEICQYSDQILLVEFQVKDKVRTFWKGHKILWEIILNFVAFLENLNFTIYFSQKKSVGYKAMD